MVITGYGAQYFVIAHKTTLKEIKIEIAADIRVYFSRYCWSRSKFKKTSIGLFNSFSTMIFII